MVWYPLREMQNMSNEELEARVIRLEERSKSTERRLTEAASGIKWIVGLLGAIAVGLFMTFVKQGVS